LQTSKQKNHLASLLKAGHGWIMIILFTNTKGGVGKSTLASHLAIYLHDLGCHVALIDADEQLSSSEWVLEAEPEITVRQVSGPEEAADAVVSLRESHQMIVCDSPGDNSDTARTLMLLTDLAVFPVGPSILDLRSLAKATGLLKHARQINHGKPEGRLLLNKVKKRDRISRSLPDAAAQLGVSLLKSEVRDLQAFRDAAQQATVVTRMDRFAAPAAQDVHALFQEILAEACAIAPNSLLKEVVND